METLEFIKKADEENIIINVPENLKGKNWKITITEIIGKISHSSKNNTDDIMKYYGTARFPDMDLDQFNVYEQ